MEKAPIPKFEEERICAGKSLYEKNSHLPVGVFVLRITNRGNSACKI